MAQRPERIVLPPRSGTASPGMSPGSGMSSPRMHRMAGEVTPAMSPLDLFAAQSRALARQLDETRRTDRRVSRLPPLTVADGLAKKPGMHSASPSSTDSHGPPAAGNSASSTSGPYSPPSEDSGIRLAVESPHTRPQSQYPRFSKINETPDWDSTRPPATETFLTPNEYPASEYFGAPRSRSPEPVRPSMESVSQHSSFSSHSKAPSALEFARRPGHPSELARGMSIESTSSRASQFSGGLHPPNPPYAQKTPSIRSVGSSDDDNPGITPSSSYSQRRKLSSSSGTSLPLSPQFQYSAAPTHQRSASQLSELSMATAGSTNRMSRPANFSRPLSHDLRPSLDLPSRMSSLDSHTRIWAEDDVPTPMSMDAAASMEEAPGTGNDMDSVYDKEDADAADAAGQNSFIYAKYSLPRGRMVDRDSLPLEALMPKIDFDRVEGADHAADPEAEPLSPPPSIGALAERPPRTSSESLPAGRVAGAPAAVAPGLVRDLRDQHRHSMTSLDTSNTGNSGSTIKASKHNRQGGSADMSAEEHLQKGIECHERGSLKESTYHLRLAARQNDPTAMLLFALACRHGWGMRQSPTEGIHWLRKAIDCANIEMSEGASGASSDKQREKRAQFALGVYELGVSHMNGWGVEHDKVLALRCFEIAAAWGDADAMAEAGFCYYQAVGCKKDLRKAAKYYRQAEAKGMSMVGNSWIHKSKYDEKPTEADERSGRSRQAGQKEDKKRDKSRTRTLFSRKRSDR